MSDRTHSAASRSRSLDDEIKAVSVHFAAQVDKYVGILPGHIKIDDFRNAFLTAVQRNPRLLEADRKSLWLALQGAAGMGLKPDGREGALVIFNDDENSSGGKVRAVQWMPMVRGLVQLVRNTGQISSLRASLVYQGEDFEVIDSDGRLTYRHKRSVDPTFDDTPDRIIGAYAVANYRDGGYEFAFFSRAQIDRRRAVSRAKKGPWGPWYDEMARKTVLRHLIKTLPQSRELDTIEDALDQELGTTIDHEPEPPIQEAIPAPKPTRQSAPRQAPPDPPPAPRPSPAHPPVQDIEPEPSEMVFEPIDQHGNAVDGVRFTRAGAFLDYLASMAESLQTQDAFTAWIDNNDANASYAIENHAEQEAADAYHAAVQAAHDRLFNPPLADDPGKLPLPMTPGGKPHWPNYIEAASKEITTLSTAAELDAWKVLNGPTYAGTASTAAAIDRLIGKRLGDIGSLNFDAPPADEWNDPDDDRWATNAAGHVRTLDQEAVKEWARIPSVNARMKAFKEDAKRHGFFHRVNDEIVRKFPT